LVSYDNDFTFFDSNRQYEEGLHSVVHVLDWDDANIQRDWDVAFIDHAPSRRRIMDIKRLADYAKIIVVHDTQRNMKFCDYKQIYPLFKYRYDYTDAIPWTTVLSNFVDITNL
jgi:hypothetical protein